MQLFAGENAGQLQLVLVLNVIDSWIGTSFLDESQSEVKSGLLSTLNLMSSISVCFKWHFDILSRIYHQNLVRRDFQLILLLLNY